MRAVHPRAFERAVDVPPFYYKYSGSIKSLHLDHIGHCKTTAGTNSSRKWACRVFMTNARSDWIVSKLPDQALDATLAHLDDSTSQDTPCGRFILGSHD